MKKWNRAIFAVLTVICLLAMTGCRQLLSMHDRPTPTVEPTQAEASESVSATEPTSTPTVVMTPTAIPTPTAELQPTPTSAPLPKNLTELARFAVDIDGDGAKETVVVATDEESGQVYVGVLSSKAFMCAVGDEEIAGYFSGAYIGYSPDGAPCVLVCMDMASEDYLTSIYAFEEEKPVLMDELYACVTKVSGSAVTVGDDLFVIGAWDYTCEYKITSGFKLERVSEMMIVTEDREPMHTVRPLPVEMLVGGVYKQKTLPVGSWLTPIATDRETYVSFSMADGSEGRILITWDDDEGFITGGIPTDGYFDNLLYWD